MNEWLQQTAQWLAGMHLRPELVVAVISGLPVFEIRGGVIVGLLVFHMSPVKTMFFGVLGNIIGVTPLLLLIEPVSKWLYGNRIADRLLHWLFARARRNAEVVNKWGMWGLVGFVAIPLPGSGAVTGSLVAIVLGIRKWRAAWALTAGIILSGLLVTLVTHGVRAGVEGIMAR